MIKKLINLSEGEIRKFFSKEVVVYEKLDMSYFRVKVNKYGAFPMKSSKNNAISDIDCVCNSVYKNMYEYSNKYILPRKDELVNKFEEVILGFFFLPVPQAKRIFYYTLNPNTVIFSDITSKNNNATTKEISSIIGCYNVPVITSRTFQEDDINTIIKYINDNKSELDIVEYILDHHRIGDIIETFTGINIEECEGVILDNGITKLQLIINDTTPNVDKLTTKIYRDTVFMNIADEIDDALIEEIKEKTNVPYIEKISVLFNHYVGRTDILTKFNIEPDDLLPPHEGYFGELDMSVFNNKDTITICNVNKTFKNILRLMLHTFSIPVSENKFKGLPQAQKDKLNKITLALQYKNFAQMALML